MARVRRPPSPVTSTLATPPHWPRRSIGCSPRLPTRGPGRAVKALIAPHGSYADSGAMAALAYMPPLLPARDIITRVVLLGPTTAWRSMCLAVPGADLFNSLGQVPVARLSDEVLTALPQVPSVRCPRRRAFARVQLPFLQRCWAVRTIPLAVGRAASAVVAEVMDALGRSETVVVVSSDLSHYHPYAVARRLDEATAHLLALQRPTSATSRRVVPHP